MSALVTVKPMQWTRMGDEWWGYVEGAGMQRALIKGRSDIGYRVSLQSGPDQWLYPTLEEAQAAAQSQWDAFIRSAIQS